MAGLEVVSSPRHFLGMPTADFLRGYWQKKPLLIRQALPGYVPPLQPEDLAGLACEDGALSRLVTYARGDDSWNLRSGPFRESDFPTLGRQDWTLLVQDMDKWDVDVRALLERFRFLPSWRLDDVMISFATPGGSVGPHVDQYDVFLLQASGRRHWQIDIDPGAPNAFRADAELKLLEHFTPSHSWTLEPGDMLYLPPGIGHHGEAVDACMTFSIGMRAPSRAELIVELAEEIAASLPEELRYEDPDLTEPSDANEIDDAAFARVDQAVDALRSIDARRQREWFGRFITRYRAAGDISAAPRTPGFAAVQSALADGGQLLRHPFSRMAWSRTEAGSELAWLFASGDAHEMDAASARALAGSGSVDAAQLSSLSPAGRDALARLVAGGHYQLKRARRTRR